MTEEDGVIEEQVLAERIGVTRDAVREFRKENLYIDKDFLSGRSIRLTKNGAEKVAEHFRVPDMPLTEKTPPRARGEAVEAVVKKIFGVNRRMIEVEMESGERKRVKVRNNRKFVVGQVVPIKGHESTAVWVLACPQPKARGRVRWRR